MGWQNLIAVKSKGGLGILGGKGIELAVFLGILIAATPTFPKLFHLFIALESGRLGFKDLCPVQQCDLKQIT